MYLPKVSPMPEFSQDIILIHAFNNTVSSCLATRTDGSEAAPVKAAYARKGDRFCGWS
jgi:hypothetical protein